MQTKLCGRATAAVGGCAAGPPSPAAPPEPSTAGRRPCRVLARIMLEQVSQRGLLSLLPRVGGQRHQQPPHHQRRDGRPPRQQPANRREQQLKPAVMPTWLCCIHPQLIPSVSIGRGSGCQQIDRESATALLQPDHQRPAAHRVRKPAEQRPEQERHNALRARQIALGACHLHGSACSDTECAVLCGEWCGSSDAEPVCRAAGSLVRGGRGTRQPSALIGAA